MEMLVVFFTFRKCIEKRSKKQIFVLIYQPSFWSCSWTDHAVAESSENFMLIMIKLHKNLWLVKLINDKVHQDKMEYESMFRCTQSKQFFFSEWVQRYSLSFMVLM